MNNIKKGTLPDYIMHSTMIRFMAFSVVGAAIVVGTWWLLVSSSTSPSSTSSSQSRFRKKWAETVEPWLEKKDAIVLLDPLMTMMSNYTYDTYLSDIPDKMVGSLAEYHKRQKLFQYNMEMIRRHNQDSEFRTGGHVLGINEFMDRFDMELPQRGYDKSQHQAWKRNAIDDSVLTVSDSTYTLANARTNVVSHQYVLCQWAYICC